MMVQIGNVRVWEAETNLIGDTSFHISTGNSNIAVPDIFVRTNSDKGKIQVFATHIASKVNELVNLIEKTI